jgi:type IV secretory pathway VirB2 component (pilin)
MPTPPTDRPLIDLSPLTANAANPAAMVATVNADLFYGSMSASMQSTLTNMLTNLSGATAQEKAWSVIYVAMLSPEFAAQR